MYKSIFNRNTIRQAVDFHSYAGILFFLFFLTVNLSVFAQTTVNFAYTGGVQNWTVPPCVTSITVTAAGAKGGGGVGGNGAVTSTTLTVTPGQVLQIRVGGLGTCPGAGYNGGATGGSANNAGNTACGGGGATDIRITPYALGNRVLVGAGGGGMGGGTTDAAGGGGGCATGVAGTSPFGFGGGGATQSSGGSAGPPWISSGGTGSVGSSANGGNGSTDPCYNLSPGGGGGGGYFGGGGGGSDCFNLSPYGGGSGGGGSSFGGSACTSGSNTGAGYATITYNTTPLTATATNTGPYCVGATIQLNVTTVAGATYSWTGPNGFTSTLQNPSIASATAANAGIYTVVVSTGPSCSVTATTTVVINPSPTVSVNSGSICAGGSLVLTATGATTYAWSPATGLSSATGNPVMASPTTTTTYTVTGTSAGCTGTATAVVTINPPFVITVTPPSPSICAGSSVTLAASGALSYVWSPSTGLSSTTTASVTANPSATTTYTITGTNAAGCTGSGTVTVTVNALPVVAVTPNPAVICSGSSIALNASGAATYSWSPATGLSAATGSLVTANPAATTTYTITGTDVNGCTSSTTSTVTVNPLPVIAVSPASASICTGSSTLLSASGASTYTWSPGTGLSATTGSSVTANPTATTTYTVTGTDANTCVSSTTVTVTVNPNAVIAVSPVSPSVCTGSSTTMTASGASTYTWSPGTGLSSTTLATVTANPTVTTTYTVTGINAAGCSGSTTVTVTVNPLPVIAVTPASPVICSGSSITLNATGASSYVWSPATGLSSTTLATVTANPTATTTYTITGTNANGCVSSTTSTVTVNPIPVLSITPASPAICSGGSTPLNATGATSYVWSPATGLSSTTLPNVTANPSATTTYTLTGTQNGCSSTQTVTVTVNANPVITINSPSICEGTTATLIAAGAGASGTYSWSPSTGLSSATGSPVTASPAVTTSYVVTGTNSNGCTGNATATITVKPLPVVSASNNGPLCPGEQLLLSSTSTAGSTFSWSGPQSFASTAQNPSISPVSSANAGAYTVTATLNGCSASATTTFAMNPTLSTVITPAGPFCSNNSAVVLTAANPGGIWSGTGITDPATGAFDPSAAAVGSNTITYNIPASCSDISTVTIIVNDLPQVSFTVDKITGCEPLDVQFANNSSQGVSSWSFGDNSTSSSSNASHEYLSDGCFDVSLTVTDQNGCISQQTMNDLICVIEKPVAEFTMNNSETSTLFPFFQFINQSSGNDLNSWEFGDGLTSAIANPSHTYPAENGNYTVWLFVENSAGCVDSTSRIVKVIEEVIFYIPNAFTPNGDEHNNVLQPVFSAGFDPYSFSFVVYNRWGETVFESKDADEGWDGTYNDKIAMDGVYTWSVKFRALDNDKKYSYAGHFVLLK